MDIRDLHLEKEKVLFVVRTPFQVLCAVSAIKNLHLSFYSIVALLAPDEPRNSQTLNALDFFNETYKVEYIGKWKRRLLNLAVFFPFLSKYKYIFLGYFNDYNLRQYGLCHASNGGTLFYLDDGLASISLLQGKLWSILTKSQISRLNLAAKIRHVDHSRCLYTIYTGLPNKKYRIYENSLSCLKNASTKSQPRSGVYFIGTNTSLYCERQKISFEKMQSFMDTFFNEIKQKYPGESIFYLKHGRDKSQFLPQLCQEHNVELILPEICSELHLLSAGTSPVMVCGFTSTVLFNVKQIFPDSEVVNLLMNSQQPETDYERLKEASKYYSEHGVILDERII